MPRSELPSPPPGLLHDAALLLDFDGTLVPFAERPDGVTVDDRLRRLIGNLGRTMGGRVAIVSGRSASEIAAFFPLADADRPAVIVAGSHGMEKRWPDGRQHAPAPPAGLADVVETLRSFAKDHPGVVMEQKPFGAALHYRQAPHAGAACGELADAVAARTGFLLQRGNMVFELRVAGATKGDAIRGFLSEPPMAGHRPVFIGDDLTDEHGFEAAAALGGAGILVGAVPDTTARYRLANVDAVRDWLEAGLESETA